MSENLTGRLLVAVPQMVDPNFARTVVLICEHNDQGALGLILNRPTEAEVFEFLPGWIHLVVDPALVFVGGPVTPEVAVGLAGTSGKELPDGYTAVAEGLGLIDLGSDPAAATGVEALRVFSGYGGWEAGQIEAEVAEGGWFVLAAQPGDGFTSHPEALWSEVLARQGGKLAMYATFPLDPSLN